MPNDPDYVVRNRSHWADQAKRYAVSGRERWSQSPRWGVWDVPEERLGLLPESMTGLDAVELGCGTAYVSAWLSRRGARPVAIDVTPEQLETARQLQGEFDLHFPLHLGNAEATPFADASFDFAISEYGAAIWCDPYKWIPEAARILRPGGQLVFLGSSTLMTLAVSDLEHDAATERLRRPQRRMHRFEWPDSCSVEFHLSPGDWIRLLRQSGFEIEDLIEIYPDERATSDFTFVTLSWALDWPCEEVWKVRKRA